MSTEQESLADAIAAVGKAEFYDQFCRYLRTYIQFDNVIVLTFHGKSIPCVHFSWHKGHNVFRFINDKYLAGAYVLDPVYDYHLEKRIDGIFRLTDIAPDQFKRSHYYEWYYGKIGIADEITVIEFVGTNTTITVSLGKDRASAMFSHRDEAQMLKRQSVIMALLKSHWDWAGSKLLRERVHAHSLVDRLIDLLRTRQHLTLSRRQAEVALLILRGHSSISIGLNLNISPGTVKVFRKQLYQKCSISSQAELFALMMPLLGEISANAHNDEPLPFQNPNSRAVNVSGKAIATA